MQAPSAGLDIAICWRLRSSWRAEALLSRVARHVAAAQGFTRGQLSVVVVGERAMSTLHARYGDDPVPTDVLAFDLGTDRRHGLLDGEIVICAAVARRRCRAQLGPGAPHLLRHARAELALYLTHGLLHLAGYDDHAPRAYRRMHAREDELLIELGLGPVFAAAAAPAPVRTSRRRRPARP